MKQLNQIHEFGEWQHLKESEDAPKYLWCPSEVSDVEQALLSQMDDPDVPSTLTSCPGYSLYLFSKDAGNYVNLSIQVGGYSKRGHNNIVLAVPVNHVILNNFGKCEKLVRLICETWSPYWAGLYSYEAIVECRSRLPERDFATPIADKVLYLDYAVYDVKSVLFKSPDTFENFHNGGICTFGNRINGLVLSRCDFMLDFSKLKPNT